MKIALMPNLTREKAKDVTFEICEWLDKYGAEYACIDNDYSVFASINNMKHMPFDELLNWCDVVISVGGDGSVLNAAKQTINYMKPILCINAGRLAFMAGLESDELELLKNLIDGNYEIDQRMLLDVTVIKNGKITMNSSCINDVTLARGELFKITDINVDCDGKRSNSYRADGVIVATPTGSSAYSLSAGGPIINPSIEVIVVTPICPQTLISRSTVFSSENEITLYCDEKSSNTHLFLSLDGDSAIDIGLGDAIKIKKSEKVAKFIRIKNDAFFEILNKKLLGK
ncbi:MAG: NAD(+)/NADH kinase [Oscillospiraceae bacterium]|nr:NAD(+)/NADH kinase [Candidatus Limimonas coprohippi]MCQ2488019.1 NAD(+)/NADH kinase [Clostridia bacterium]